MPTLNPRINLTLGAPTVAFLAEMAQGANQSVAGLVKELMLEALEHREDVALSSIARLRSEEGKTRVKHADAWG